MTAKAEFDAAYFTLLRAREERDDLLRYAEYLETEQLRLETFATQTRDNLDALPRKMTKAISSTTKTLLEAVGRRRAAVLDERKRMDERLANADRFVQECELELDALRR